MWRWIPAWTVPRGRDELGPRAGVDCRDDEDKELGVNVMEIRELALPGVVRVRPRVFRDERGFFSESWNKDDYPTPAARPARSVLGSERLDAMGIAPLPPWTESLLAVVAGQKKRFRIG